MRFPRRRLLLVWETDYFEANWQKCRASADLGRFRGSSEASFTTHDFVRFREEVRSLLETISGTASFATLGGAFE
jgi:hypothetical protein